MTFLALVFFFFYYHIQKTVTQMMMKCCLQYPIEIKITPLIRICAVLIY